MKSTSRTKRRQMVLLVLIAAGGLAVWYLGTSRLEPEFDQLLYGAYEGARIVDLRSRAMSTYGFLDRKGNAILAPAFGLAHHNGAVWSPADGALLVWRRDGYRDWRRVPLPDRAKVAHVAVREDETCIVLRNGAGLVFVTTRGDATIAIESPYIDCRATDDGWAVLDRAGGFWLIAAGRRRHIPAPSKGEFHDGWDYSADWASIIMTVSRTRVGAIVADRYHQFRAPWYTFVGSVAAVRGSTTVAVEAAQPYSTGVQVWLWSPVGDRKVRIVDEPFAVYHPVLVATDELLELLEVVASRDGAIDGTRTKRQ